MGMTDAMAMELEHEAGAIRKTLERIPEEKYGWTPHDRSMPMGKLASHIAELAGWAVPTLQQDSLDLPPEYKPWIAATSGELLERFDRNLERALKVLRGYPDHRMMENWTLTSGGQVFFSLPRAVVLRNMVFNHLIHHRGQLTVYLRLNGIPVPAVYGPSADEQ